MNKYIPQFCKELILIHVLIQMLVRCLLVKEEPLDTYNCVRHLNITCINDGLDTRLHPLFYAQCNGITFWLSIIDALTSTLDSQHAWVITPHCFNKKLKLILVLIPVLVWQISVSESNPFSFSWAFYGCFVCILVNFVTWWVSKYYITSVYDIMWLIYLRPGWQNTFPPFDTYWINNVTNV